MGNPFPSSRVRTDPATIRDAWILPALVPLLTPSALETLRGRVRDSYWEAAVREGLSDDEPIGRAVAARFQLRLADLKRADSESRLLVSEQLARRYRVLPLRSVDGVLEVASSDPRDLDCERALAFATGRAVRLSLASPLQIDRRLDDLYRTDPAGERLLAGGGAYEVQILASSEEAEDAGSAAAEAAQRPIVRLVDELLAEGVVSRASDIHIACEERVVTVRYRIDGVLRGARELPRDIARPVISRIKVVGGLDIADRLRPQDGRARLAVDGAHVDLRISTLPSVHGEKVVIRLLHPGGSVLALDAMGFHGPSLGRLERLADAREGIVLVTGPTGSGKTTTLYATLRRIQRRDPNIVTVEDPVEYRLPGIVQVQVNERAGLTFASALRAILRQDPDVVLVGEIRDRDTAATAVQASLTGHLVLSTLHTMDAAGAIVRLHDLGVEPYHLAAAVRGIVAQRLLRRLCTACRALDNGDAFPATRRWLGAESTIPRAVGCGECGGSGYRGRLAVAEVLLRSAEVERRVASGATVDQIAAAARADGMLPLWESGLGHVRRGDTTLDELLRVIEPPPSADGDRDFDGPEEPWPSSRSAPSTST
jgi:type II secretory ATPase GspE/PulE/Tfp pilus assembly ATPase PilB-like protein